MIRCARRRVAVGTYMGMYLCIVFFNSNFNDLKVTVEGPGFPYSHVSVRVLPVGISVSH